MGRAPVTHLKINSLFFHQPVSAYESDIMKVGLLKCREEPPKLLQGTKFQERSFQIKEHKLLLLKDKKVGGQPPASFNTLRGTSQS